MNAITKTVVDHLIDGDGWQIVKEGIEELESFDDAIPKFLQIIYTATIYGINKEFQPEFRQMLFELTNIIANTIEVDEVVNAAMEKYKEQPYDHCWDCELSAKNGGPCKVHDKHQRLPREEYGGALGMCMKIGGPGC